MNMRRCFEVFDGVKDVKSFRVRSGSGITIRRGFPRGATIRTLSLFKTSTYSSLGRGLSS